MRPTQRYLSTPWSQWADRQRPPTPKSFEALVIGSGYGGSVAALRLAQKGWKVTLLERGSEYVAGDFPNDMAWVPKHVRAPSLTGETVLGTPNGLVELRAGPSVVSVVANGLGGGSLINAGVVIEPDDDVLAQSVWPLPIRMGSPPLAPFVKLAHEMLGPYSSAAFDDLHKSRALNTLGQHLPEPQAAQTLELTINPAHCTRCGDCASGCNVPGAKITLKDNYLQAAVELGAKLLTSVTVYALRSLCDAQGQHRSWGLRVIATEHIGHFQSLQEAAALPEEGGAGLDIEAQLVVVAAGTFGSTELLQRSHALEGQKLWISPALGSRFSGNGDSLSFSINEPDPVNAIGYGVDTWHPLSGTVGPSITRTIDLRHRPSVSSAKAPSDGQPRTDRPPLEMRLLIQDGAVPAAMARLYAEVLATSHTAAQLGRWRWEQPRQPNCEPLSAGHWLRAHLAIPSGPFDANTPSALPLPQHTQVLLTMGHDGSQGRIIWVPDRNASVPYWDSPERLTTYRYQERVLSHASDGLGGLWAPSPLWRLLPKTATQLLSGPKPAPLMTTVHPLGGCPMGDDPHTSVVDHLGRVWAGKDDSRPRHPLLYVLDGSIVPSALGCNPLLTITALAERAMSLIPSPKPMVDKRTTHEDAAALLPPDPITITPANATDLHHRTRPHMPMRDAPLVLPVAMEERLTCPQLPLFHRLKQGMGHAVAAAELRLRLNTPDWLSMWDDPKHHLEVNGELTLEAPISPCHTRCTPACHPTCSAARGALVVYRIQAGKAQLFSSESAPVRSLNWRPRNPLLETLVRYFDVAIRLMHVLLRGRLHLLRAILTLFITRPDLCRSLIAPIKRQFRHSLGQAPTGKLPEILPSNIKIWPQIVNGLKSLMHACEIRSMHYQLKAHLTPQRSHQIHDMPPSIMLRGEKRVDYAADWCEIFKWLWKGRHVNAPLRPSFFTQVSRLSVSLHTLETAHRPAITLAPKAFFQMDSETLLGRPPIHLTGPGDLPSSIAALMAYPLVFARFMLKTRMYDFALPQYSGRALPDDAPASETRLRSPWGAVDAQALDFYVPQGLSSSDPASVQLRARLRLRLWRYRRPATERHLPACRHALWHDTPVRKVRSILLVPAFAQSGYTFTLKTVEQNLAEALYAAGYEVWILEHRLSTRLPAHTQQSTMDQMARYDLPRAVNKILQHLEEDLGAGPPLQIQAFAQCVGAGVSAMALLSGRLSYAPVDTPQHSLTPKLPKLSGVIFSQMHPFLVGTELTQAKTWVPKALRDVLRWNTIPFAIREPQVSPITTMMDRLLSAMPIPPEENCPPRQSIHGPTTIGVHGYMDDDDDCATCKRIRFIEAPLFSHHHLNRATHRALPLLFGNANLRTFVHMARNVDAERLVTEDGEHRYATDANAILHMALPICFMHGMRNELFHSESAQRSARHYAQVQPAWSAFAAGASVNRLQPDACSWLLPDYGHLDPLIGQTAHTDVFPGVIARLQHWHDHDMTAPHAVVQRESTFAAARLPWIGPCVGAVYRDPETQHLCVRVTFHIDDRFSDAKGSAHETPGTRTWAFARWKFMGRERIWHVQSMSILNKPVSREYLNGMPRPKDLSSVMRMACVDLRIDDTPFPPLSDLVIECFSIHEVVHPHPSVVRDDIAPLPTGLTHLREGDAVASPDALHGIAQLINRCRQKCNHLARDSQRPQLSTVSRLRRQPERYAVCRAWIRRHSLDTLAPREPCSAMSTHFAVGSCRFPGTAIEQERVDLWTEATMRATDLAPTQSPSPAFPAAFGLLLGDQIYADRSAGFADETNPLERYFQRHQTAFARQSRTGQSPTLGDWLSSMPVLMVPDDHEFINGYPDGAPLAHAPLKLRAKAQRVSWRAARRAQFMYQGLQTVPWALTAGAWSFEAGCVRVLALDVRTYRRPLSEAGDQPGRLLRPQQCRAIHRWLQAPQARHQLNVLTCGNVILPAQDSRRDPSNGPGHDGWQACQADRQVLLELLAQAHDQHGEAFRILLISGDYHLGTAAPLLRQGQTLGACVVVPPLYSPMPFLDTPPDALDWPNDLPGGFSTGTPLGPWRGNGLSCLSVTPQASSPARGAQHYVLRFQAHTRIPDACHHGQASPIDVEMVL